MKKAMFHKFTNFIQQAVETFAPNISPQEEFVYHWKSVTSYFVDNKDGCVRIEETALPEHLDSMLRILQEEESELGEAGTTGMCMEYLLQHRLLETLYTLGRTDHPPGMKQCVLRFFTKLLSRISHPLLPHINVYRAVQRLVKACGETKAGPAEKEEIEFLCTVCAKIKTDPYLVNFFIESPSKSAKTPHRTVPAFSLLDALLALSTSQDARVSLKACEGMMLCASLPEQSAALALISQTKFCHSIAQTLTELYRKLPMKVNLDDIEMIEAKWGFNDINDRHDEKAFPGKRQVISFLSWLDYCDQLIAVANPDVGEALSREIHQQLLTGCFSSHLLQASESGSLMATVYITRCLRTVCSPALLKEFSYFLLGSDRGLESKDNPGHLINKRLLERCNHLSEELCLVTLKLYDTLLQKEDEHIFHCLLLRTLLGRSYLQLPSLPSQDTVSDSTQDENLEDKKNASKEEDKPDDFVGQTTSSDNAEIIANNEDRDSSQDHSRNIANNLPSEVHKVVNSFLTLLPDEIKSTIQTVDCSYDMYLRDASKQFAIQERVCKSWGWPKQPISELSFSMEKFHQGPFLQMLFDKLLHMLDQSYSVNLLLTSLISKVALVPHPNLHEYLLDPFLPVAEGTHTLYSVLIKVTNEIKHHQKTDSTFPQKLILARKQLFGLVPNIHSLRLAKCQTEVPCDGGGFEDQSRMEAIIVLEEFCKELSAITFVKHHAAVTKS
uniref:FHF complex subunit HOOK-interacting protein C-terminal domain-containing protein n=1 Tax=Biomphalaria glabrata TaxID=6526 RepID=A0A2C9LS27_BIOGL